MELSQRIKKLIEYSNLSVRAFAIKCDLTQPALDRYIKGQAIPTSTALIKIAKTFPEVSGDWLLKEEGNMLREENRSEEEERHINRLLKLTDTITSLQETINIKNDTIEILTGRIKELENQLN